MRKIKFRAYCKKDKMMYHDIQSGISFDDNSHYGFENFLEKQSNDYHEWEVMQFTGLLDKQGVEIFEGDIVEINDWNGATGEHIAEIYWCNNYLQWSVQWLPKQSGTDSLRYIKKMLKKTDELPNDDLGNLRWPQLKIINKERK